MSHEKIDYSKYQPTHAERIVRKLSTIAELLRTRLNEGEAKVRHKTFSEIYEEYDGKNVTDRKGRQWSIKVKPIVSNSKNGWKSTVLMEFECMDTEKNERIVDRVHLSDQSTFGGVNSKKQAEVKMRTSVFPVYEIDKSIASLVAKEYVMPGSRPQKIEDYF